VGPPAFPQKSRDESSRFKGLWGLHNSVKENFGAPRRVKRSHGYIKAIAFCVRVVYVPSEGLHGMLKPKAARPPEARAAPAGEEKFA